MSRGPRRETSGITDGVPEEIRPIQYNYNQTCHISYMNSEPSCLPGDAKGHSFCKQFGIFYLIFLFLFMDKSCSFFNVYYTLCKWNEYFHELISIFVCVILNLCLCIIIHKSTLKIGNSISHVV